MKLHWEPITLELRTTFRVAHGASDVRNNVLVYLDDGVGEAAAVPYYGETQEGIIEYLKSVPDLGEDPFDLDAVLAKRPVGSRAARSAIDEALHDLWGKKLGQPLYRLFGLNPNSLPLTSFTIGMDEPQVMAEQAKKSGYPILKIKLGGEDDEARVKAIRDVTSAKLRVRRERGLEPRTGASDHPPACGLRPGIHRTTSGSGRRRRVFLAEGTVERAEGGHPDLCGRDGEDIP